MGSSSKTTKTDMGPWGPTQGRLIDRAMPQLDQAYDTMAGNPLIGQAQGYTSDVLGGKYLTPDSNPYLMNYANAAMRQFQSGQNTLMARAGRGNLSGGDMQQAMGQGMTQALVAPLMQQYNIERGYQDTASRAAPALQVASGAPAEWYAGQMANLGRLGQKGTTTETTSQSPMQSITGAAITALGAMTGNPAMMAGGFGAMGGGGGGMGGYGGSSYYAQNPAWAPIKMPWQT
jgi:hypothetical protein